MINFFIFSFLISGIILAYICIFRPDLKYTNIGKYSFAASLSICVFSFICIVIYPYPTNYPSPFKNNPSLNTNNCYQYNSFDKDNNISTFKVNAIYIVRDSSLTLVPSDSSISFNF